MKIKENEKIDKYSDLSWELKKLWNMGVKEKLIVVSALGTVLQNLEKGLDEMEGNGRTDTLPATAFLRSERILRRVLETWGDWLLLRL